MRSKSVLLSDAISAEGYMVKFMQHPARVRGGLGTGFQYMKARVFKLSCPKTLSGIKYHFGVALINESWDWAYSASHEIAEHRWGFKHSADMFCEQSNLLSRWLIDVVGSK